MYESYFQFQSAPFPATPVVTNYFPAESIETARESLVRLVERAEGPGLVIGQAGVGKSLLLRILSDHFSSRFRIVFLSGARIVTRKAFIQYILFELGLPFRGMDEGELRLALIDTLRPTENSPTGILLLIDEAHTLPLRLLEETRMITNVVRDGQPRVRLVLAGDSRLEERFASPKLESFNQRIAARCYLQPFTRDETHEFVRAELSWVGGDPDSLFSEDAIRAVYDATEGIPRLVNQVCDHALITAHSGGARHIDAAMVEAAWSNLQQLPLSWHAPRSESPAPKSTVIEFGQLDEIETTNAPFESAAFEATSSEDSDEIPTTLDEHPVPSNLDDSIADLEYHVESLLVGGTASDVPAEWIECGAAAMELELSPLPAPMAELPAKSEAECMPAVSTPMVKAPLDPFGTGFDEEIIVVDRDAVNEIEAFRGRPRVTCSASCEIAAELHQHYQRISNTRSETPSETGMKPVAGGVGTVFEFNTLHAANDESASEIEFTAHEKIESGVADVNGWESDDDVHCVPLPWTRGTLGDDRDMIIVEDDAPDYHGAGVNQQFASGTRQVDYHELFLQLRRSTHP